jgi:hypothetical protein
MITTKDLTVTDSTIDVSVSETDFGNDFSLQYPTGGAGTLVVEATLDEVTWEDLTFVKSDDTGATVVATAAAAGLYIGTVPCCKKIRVRKSVGSAALSPLFGIGSTY